MLANYLPVLIFLVVGAALAGVLLGLGSGLGRYLARTPQRCGQATPYECGFDAFEDTRMKFDVRYYLVAILFIVFDLEIAFLFPWAVALPKSASLASSPWGSFSRSSWSDSSMSGKRALSNGTRRVLG
jgi:NADH-quinone oxidoreductase subunit A